jgi:hypothetical protein
LCIVERICRKIVDERDMNVTGMTRKRRIGDAEIPERFDEKVAM